MVVPLYMTIEDAAAYAGIGVKTLRKYLNGPFPPPYLEIGRKKLIQTAALPGYLEHMQKVRLEEE